MTESAPESVTPESSDLEYDLVHESSGGAGQPGVRRRSRPEQVIELPEPDLSPDGEGDYGYDLAHDVPRGGVSP